MVPAEASAPRMKLTGPLAVPPPASGSRDDRMLDRLSPDPDPPLKIVPSSTYQLRMADMVSSTARMKQADAWAGTPFTPMLNHTGELNAARWWSDDSRSGVPSCPRKYFWATMLVEFCDQVTGNSTPGWKKASPPDL